MIPFSLQCNPELAEFFYKMKITVALSTYQAGKVVFISATSPDKLVQLPRNFDTPMGIALDKNRLAIATVDEVVQFTNEPTASVGYDSKKEYDAFFVPTASFHTGRVHMHDIEFGEGGIYGVNTNFSMLGLINGEYSFLPIWKPPFIEHVNSQDQCHLNGMAMQDGKPKYVTILGISHQAGGWRKNKLNGGILMDVQTNEIILRNLQMPHSPRLHNGKLYLLQSASGTLSEVNLETKTIEVIKNLKGFVRGMSLHGDYAFIGLSKIRETSTAFWDMPIAQYKNRSGFVVVHLPTKAIIGEVTYENSVDEVYDIRVLPDTIRPNILSNLDEGAKRVIVYPNVAFWQQEVKENKKIELRRYFLKETHNDVEFYDIHNTRDYDQFIIEFWLKHALLAQKEAYKRVEEVAVIAVVNHEIIGIVTVYEALWNGQSYYYKRMSISPDSGHNYLWKGLSTFTVNTFQKRNQMEEKPVTGLIIEIENEKLNQVTVQKFLEQSNWSKEKKNDKQQTVWRYLF